MPEPTAGVTAVSLPAQGFDGQALRYDARAGLPESVCHAVARAIVDLADARAEDLVAELGAGTGEIGVQLARMPIRYVGLDASAAMLDGFRAKAAEVSPSLVVADCNRPWPLPDGSTSVLFASRVIHLLEPEHAVRETLRVSRPAGLLIMGRAVRDRDGIMERLHRRRLDLLQKAGVSARLGEDGTRRVINGCVARGGESLGRQFVAEWTRVTTPREIISSWESLTRMGSVLVDATVRGEILSELRRWARAELGDPDRQQASTTRYALDVVRMPSRAASR